ncbi:MAG: hypothetical protein JNK63_08420 [Chthonomonas sp.]|nr:hypothetical protein [Chthonomonas sp.]
MQQPDQTGDRGEDADPRIGASKELDELDDVRAANQRPKRRRERAVDVGDTERAEVIEAANGGDTLLWRVWDVAGRRGTVAGHGGMWLMDKDSRFTIHMLFCVWSPRSRFSGSRFTWVLIS